MVISFGFALCLEYTTNLTTLLRKRQQQQRQRGRSSPRHTNNILSRRQEAFRLYAMSSLLGYLNMLVVMSYSIELLLSVVVGHMAGQYYFGLSSASSLSPFSVATDDSLAIEKEKLATDEGDSASGSSKLESLVVCCLRLLQRRRSRSSSSWREALSISMPGTRERLRRLQSTRQSLEKQQQSSSSSSNSSISRGQQQQQERSKPIRLSSFATADDESENMEESASIHDEDDMPLLRKRDMKG
jgi:Ctr copper transporter family